MSLVFTMLWPPSRTITFEAALRDLGSTDPAARVAAADALGDAAEADRARACAALIGALRDERFEVRCASALALGDLGDASALEPLLEKLADGHREARQAGVIALGRLGDARAVAPLTEALESGPADVRFQAARSLAELDAAAAYEPLVRALRDEDAEVRESAAEALALVGDRRAAGWVAELLADARPGTRFAAAMTLAVLGDARGVDVLLAALGERERAWDAIEGLEALADARAADPLAAAMRKFLAPVHTRIRAAGALLVVAPGHAAAAEARAYLMKQARSRRAELRGLAEELLAALEPRA